MSNFGLSTPSIDLKGDFNVNEPTKSISSDLYGFLPQLFWFNGKACFPTAVTNALAGMATSYKKPELLAGGADRNDQLLNTMYSLAKKLKTNDEVGTYQINYVNGIEGYFAAQGIPNEISVNFVNKKSFPEIISAFAKGPVILHDQYTKESAGHALTAIELEFDDANNNMRIDKGEAYVKVIDPLDPATNYIQTEPAVFGEGTNSEKLERWSKTIQASPDAEPKIKRVQVYQSKSGPIKFDYMQYGVTPAVVNGEASPEGIEIKDAGLKEGTIEYLISLLPSLLPANADELIAPSKENDVVFDFSSFIEDGKVSGELFSYFNED